MFYGPPINERRKPFDERVLRNIMEYIVSLKGHIFSVKLISKHIDCDGNKIRDYRKQNRKMKGDRVYSSYNVGKYMPHLLDSGAIVIDRKSVFPVSSKDVGRTKKVWYVRRFKDDEIDYFIGVMRNNYLMRRENEM